MIIEYLNELKNNQLWRGISKPIQSISISEIEQLEQLWNNSIFFPKALRELLFLAGQNCYVLDYGWNGTQQNMQTKAREWMVDHNRIITRSFYVIDVYNAGDQFLMVYLDEGDNPNVYSVFLPQGWEKALGSGNSWICNTERTLKDFLAFRINKVKQGINPF